MAYDEMPKPEGVGGIVPHFYYDLLGRIVPGLYLIVAGYWLLQLRGNPPALGEPLSAIAIIVVVLMAYLVSFVIGPCSHWCFDWLCRFNKKDISDEVKQVLDRNKISHPTEDDKGNLHKSLVKQSELSVYTLWLRAPQLAIICSRWDAEAFAARQIGMVTIILFAVTTGLMLNCRPPNHATTVLFLSVVTTALSAVQFRYSRRKAVLARFRMLSRALSETAKSAGA